jgi:surfeit locus 1 family protein
MTGKATHRNSDSPTGSLRDGEPESRPRSNIFIIIWALVALVTFSGFTALAIWQVQRLDWKQNLIERVNQRVEAPASPAPGPNAWPAINEQDDAYRHVSVTGQLLHEKTTPVQTSTELGQGFWLMTPLQQADGSLVMINQGFVTEPPEEKAANPGDNQRVTITGLLRLSQIGGGVLRDNDPATNRWYSRDVEAIATAKALPIARVAPYFIDADARGQIRAPHSLNQTYREPVGGLTVISFYNHHLQYALTWFALALMVGAGALWVGREERLVRKRHRWQTAQPQSAKQNEYRVKNEQE